MQNPEYFYASKSAVKCQIEQLKSEFFAQIQTLQREVFLLRMQLDKQQACSQGLQTQIPSSYIEQTYSNVENERNSSPINILIQDDSSVSEHQLSEKGCQEEPSYQSGGGKVEEKPEEK